ncbi:MAG TPA: acetyl-CoA carboxylase biotin carboxyl carrier protein [Polyangiaceae bacterium]|nr:acetyl-CoA carboxylase biotin carboxyl carrier protein [Polyangiaceae bacterium]
MHLSLEELKNLFKTLEAGGVAEFEYQDEKYRVKVGLARPAAPAVVAVPQASPARASSPLGSPAPVARPVDENLAAVTSPFVGTFYRAPSPDVANFVEVGSVVRAGQTLCIVEAMKLMNEIEAEVAGTIVDVLVENGKSVEYGQKLFTIRKG